MIDKPIIDRVQFTWCQDGNTLGTTDECEVLHVQLELTEPGEPPFIVLKTETGWSIDEPSELTALLERCLKAVKEDTDG